MLFCCCLVLLSLLLTSFRNGNHWFYFSIEFLSFSFQKNCSNHLIMAHHELEEHIQIMKGLKSYSSLTILTSYLLTLLWNPFMSDISGCVINMLFDLRRRKTCICLKKIKISHSDTLNSHHHWGLHKSHQIFLQMIYLHCN